MTNRIRDRLDALRPQPRPVTLRVARIDTTAGPQTVIVRSWAPLDATSCRLCPRATCDAKGDVCMVVVIGHVATTEAAMFRNTTPPGEPSWPD